MVRALVGMNAIMSTQVGFAIERLVELVNYLSREQIVFTFPHLSHEQLNPREPPGAMLILVNCVCCDNKIKYGERKRIVCGGINRSQGRKEEWGW